MPVRIAVVIPRYGLPGGSEGFAHELTSRLARRPEWEVHVFANAWGRADEGVVFHRVPRVAFPRFLRPLAFASLAGRRVRRAGCSLVHSHERIYAMDLFTVHGIPHRTWIQEARGKRPSLYDRAVAHVEERGLLHGGARLILPVSHLVKDALLGQYPIPAQRLRVLPPGVDTARFCALDRGRCRKEVRLRHGIPPGEPILLFVGMNFAIKRLDLVLKGVGLWLERRPGAPLRVLVVGKGDPSPYLSLARDLGLADRVVFAGVTREVEAYYKGSDLFAMPSVYDTFGMAVLEAMAAGLPVIISEGVGARDCVQDGVHGVVLGRNPSGEAFAEALGRLMDRDTRLRMGEETVRVAAAHSWERLADTMADLFSLTLEEKRRQRRGEGGGLGKRAEAS